MYYIPAEHVVHAVNNCMYYIPAGVSPIPAGVSPCQCQKGRTSPNTQCPPPNNRHICGHTLQRITCKLYMVALHGSKPRLSNNIRQSSALQYRKAADTSQIAKFVTLVDYVGLPSIRHRSVGTNSTRSRK